MPFLLLVLVSQFFGFVLARIDISKPGDNRLGITEILSWTGMSIKLATGNSKVLYVPSTLNNIVTMPEVRGSDPDAMLLNGFPLGRNGDEESYNTAEGVMDPTIVLH